MVRGNNEAETLSPLDGTVVAVNPKISANSKDVNSAPYAEGWLMVVQPKNLRKSLKNLLFGVESLAWTDDEASRLTTLLNEEGDTAIAATSSEAMDPCMEQYPRWLGRAGKNILNKILDDFMAHGW